MCHRGGEAPAHRHQGGIRAGAEDDGRKGRADGAAPEEQGCPFGRGGLDDAGSPVYFKKITVTPDDERAWFRMHPQWSKSNR